jgi:hypothetical protein
VVVLLLVSTTITIQKKKKKKGKKWGKGRRVAPIDYNFFFLEIFVFSRLKEANLLSISFDLKV